MTNEQMRRELDEHCKQEDPAYRPTDDSIANRRDWSIWQAATSKATQAERERAIAACQVRAAAGKKARNTQYQVGCSECIDAIRLALPPTGTGVNHG